MSNNFPGKHSGGILSICSNHLDWLFLTWSPFQITKFYTLSLRESSGSFWGETNFGRLYSQFCSFGHHLQFIIRHESGSVDRSVIGEISLSDSVLSLSQQTCTVWVLITTWTKIDSPVNLLLSHRYLRYLNYFARLSSTQRWPTNFFWLRTSKNGSSQANVPNRIISANSSKVTLKSPNRAI